MKLPLTLLCFLLALSLCASAQQPAPATAPQAQPQATDPKLHENVLKLIDLMGSRHLMQEGLEKTMPDARAKMLEAAPTLSPEFADEWVKRMKADEHIEDYVNVIVVTYEKHFNNEEIAELISVQQDVNDKKTPVLSDHLKSKLAADAVTIQSEILGGCTQVGAKLGGDIAQAIGKEHPEWVKASAPSSDPEPKK